MRSVPIHGELTADGTRVVVMAAGMFQDDVERVGHQLGLLTPTPKPTEPKGGITFPVSWALCVQLAATFGSAWRPGPRLQSWMAEQVRNRVAGHSLLWDLIGTMPEGLTPRPYQVDGARMIQAVGSCLITDEPGTGKTITTLLGLLCRKEWPAVVICPASVVDPWVRAWQTWAPHLRTVAWRGTVRAKLLGAADVYVTSYDTATRDIGTIAKPGTLLKLAPTALVIDECHLIKNPNSKRSSHIRRLAKKADCVVALSGTPITHNPADLWPTLVALDPVAWPARERWVTRYCETLPGDYSDKVLGLDPLREAEFRDCLLGQHRRVAKADVLDQLPPKVYSTRTIELPAEYRKAYNALEKDFLARMPDGQWLAAQNFITSMGQLNLLACAAADVEVTYETDPETGLETPHYHVELKAPSWKVDALMEVLDERPGQQVVVFAPSKQLVELAGAAAAKAGYRVGYIVGGQTPKRRTEIVDRFQAGQLDVMYVTTQAGGVGITLTAASTAVFLQRPWSLVDALQAEDRLHRIGAEHHECIEIVDIIAANTIDSRVRTVLREKAGQLADLVQDPRIVAELLGGSSTSDREKAA